MTTIGAAQLPEQLRQKADQLRIHSIRSTTQAGSGHPSSCCSAADIVATLFFSVMRYDPKNPRNPDNDRFVFRKAMQPHCCMPHGPKQAFLNLKNYLNFAH